MRRFLVIGIVMPALFFGAVYFTEIRTAGRALLGGDLPTGIATGLIRHCAKSSDFNFCMGNWQPVYAQVLDGTPEGRQCALRSGGDPDAMHRCMAAALDASGAGLAGSVGAPPGTDPRTIEAIMDRCEADHPGDAGQSLACIRAATAALGD